MTIVLDQPWQIELARLQVLKHGLRLEIKGMKRRGRSISSILKGEPFNITGTRPSQLRKLEELITRKEREAGLPINKGIVHQVGRD